MIISYSYNHLKSKLILRGFATIPWTMPRRISDMNLAVRSIGDGGEQQFKLRGDYAPVYVSLGLILLSTTLGLITAKQHLLHDPTVRVKKSRREKLTEIEEPELVANETDRFIKRSFFRRLAHVQQYVVPRG